MMHQHYLVVILHKASLTILETLSNTFVYNHLNELRRFREYWQITQVFQFRNYDKEYLPPKTRLEI